MAIAVVDRGIHPARRVVELAAAGQLVGAAGDPLPPFETNPSTVRDQARLLRRRRAGEAVSTLAAQPHRDAIEALRRRLVSVADTMLTAYERDVKRDAAKANPERFRQIIRCVREAAGLPGPNDPRPPAPGQKVGGERDGGETTGGLAGQVLKAAGMGRPPVRVPVERPEPSVSPSMNGGVGELEAFAPDPRGRVADQLRQELDDEALLAAEARLLEDE